MIPFNIDPMQYIYCCRLVFAGFVVSTILWATVTWPKRLSLGENLIQ